MAEGFDVDLPTLRAAARALRGDAATIGTAARIGGDALVSAGAAAGSGPLEGVAAALAAQFDSGLSSARRNVEGTASALDGATAAYESSDAAASRSIGLLGF